MAPYKKWRAEQQGNPIKLTRARENGVYVTKAVGVRNGELILRYDDSLPEHIFCFLGGMVFLVSIIGLIRFPTQLSLPILARHDQLIVSALKTGFVAVLVAAGLGLITPPDRQRDSPSEREAGGSSLDMGGGGSLRKRGQKTGLFRVEGKGSVGDCTVCEAGIGDLSGGRGASLKRSIGSCLFLRFF